MLNNLTKVPPTQLLASDSRVDNYVEVLEAKVWGFVVVAVTLILCFIVISLLYSVTFVTQPIKSMAPIDQAYTKMLNDIVLLIVGGIGGVMSKRAVGAMSKALSPTPTSPSYPCATAATTTQYAPASQPAPSTGMPNFNWMGYQNPELDETWTPGPPPNTPPNYVHPEAEEIAQERAAARSET